VSNVTNMEDMFYDAISFDLPLHAPSSWDSSDTDSDSE